MNGNETFAIWLNKYALALLEMPFRHTLRPREAGWEIEVLESGRLQARFTDGFQEHYDVEPGDTLFASGEEIYVTFQRSRKGGRPDGEGGGKGQGPRQPPAQKKGAPEPPERAREAAPRAAARRKGR
ncbi:MAG TPA: hypothetical protein VHG08_18045 [Longimicrobium sp.]|nr:hypothetical protein [Longimicrobium sp.]